MRSHERRGTGRRAGAVGAALVIALTAAGCSGRDDGLAAPADSTPVSLGTSLGDSTTSDGRTSTTAARPSTTGAATTGPSAAPTTTVPPVPVAIEDTLADPAEDWPVAGIAPGPTRVTFSDGTDNQLLASIYQPVLPTVPHGAATAAGSSYLAAIDGFEFPDASAAAAWLATYGAYQADEVANLVGNVHVERHPLVGARAGWSGYVVDAVFSGAAGVQWQRTATLVKAHGRRGFVVTVRWFGDSAAGVPILDPAITALATAQDDHLTAERIAPTAPATGPAERSARLALVERAAPWAVLLGQPDIDPAAGSQALIADTPDGLPLGVRPDGATAVAARVVCGAGGCPVFSIVSQFPDAAAATAAAARWALPEANFGPLDEVAFPAGATVSAATPLDASAVPGAVAYTAMLSDGTTSYQAAAGWLVRGDTVYGAVAVYGSAARNAEVVAATLAGHAARLTVLGLA